MSWLLHYLQLIDYCDTLFVHYSLRLNCFRYWLNSLQIANFYPSFEKFLILITFKFNHIPGRIFFNCIHYRNYSRKKAKIVETLLPVHAFYDIEKYLTSGGGRKALYKLYTESMQIWYPWNKIASVKFYTFIRLLKSICAYEQSTNDVNTVGYRDPCVVYDCLSGMMYEKKRRHKIRVAFEAGFPTAIMIT
jgi:hypothetical protein